MTNVIRAKDKFRPDNEQVQIDVAPILNLMETLFRAGGITANTYRLGHIVCAHMQAERSYEISLNRSIAAVTAVAVDGDPKSSMVDPDSLQFTMSLRQLQAYMGLYNHIAKAGVKRAKDRFTHFTSPTMQRLEDKLLGVDEEVFFMYRPEEQDALEEYAAEVVHKNMWLARFMEIRTDYK